MIDRVVTELVKRRAKSTSETERTQKHLRTPEVKPPYILDVVASRDANSYAMEATVVCVIRR